MTHFGTTILDHLAEYFLYLAAAPSFRFSLNSSYDHEFHLSRQLGMSPDDYECIMVAAKLAEFHKMLTCMVEISWFVKMARWGLLTLEW